MVISDALEFCRDYNVIFRVEKYTEVTVPSICIVASVIAASKSGTQWTRPLRDLCTIFDVKNSAQLRGALLNLEEQGVIDISGKTRDREYQPRMLDRSDKQIVICLDAIPTKEGKFLCSPRFQELDPNNVTYAMIGFDDVLTESGTQPGNVKAYIATSIKDSSLKNTWFAINNVKRIPDGTAWLGDDFWQVTTPEFLAPYAQIENVAAPIPEWASVNRAFWDAETSKSARESMFNKAVIDAMKTVPFQKPKSIPGVKTEAIVSDPEIPAVVVAKSILDSKPAKMNASCKSNISKEKVSYTLLETMMAINDCNLPQVLKDVLADAYAFKHAYKKEQ